MKIIIALMVFLFANSTLAALDDDSIYGTYSVVFQPSQAEGNLQGCTLVFKSVQADFAYLNGDPIVALGNIGIRQYGPKLILTLKIGVNTLKGNAAIVRPNFAYIQTKTFSTAKVKQQSHDGDEGFSLYAYSFFDTTVLNLFKEMMDTRKVTVAFNRKKDGLDVLVPIDLDVIGAESSDGDKVFRKRSNQAPDDFTKCLLTLTEQAERSLEK